MSFYELMLKSLSDLSENGETIKNPIYGTLLQGKRHYFGYFGLTDNYLLIALLLGDSKSVGYTSRIPLNSIRQVKLKKSLIPLQYKIYIDFDEGQPAKIQVSKKVYGFETQEENLKLFLECINR